ncbi:MAG: hypothetical protein WBD22_13440 [Pyrinomonadaceae bacterium]
MIVYFVVGILLVLSGVAIFFVWANRHSQLVLHYFILASAAYVTFGRADALQAAITAATVLSPDHLRIAERELSSLYYSCSIITDEIDTVLFERQSMLYSKIVGEQWTFEDQVSNKLVLRKMNPTFLKALHKPNPKIFLVEYESLREIDQSLKDGVSIFGSIFPKKI